MIEEFCGSCIYELLRYTGPSRGSLGMCFSLSYVVGHTLEDRNLKLTSIFFNRYIHGCLIFITSIGFFIGDPKFWLIFFCSFTIPYACVLVVDVVSSFVGRLVGLLDDDFTVLNIYFTDPFDTETLGDGDGSKWENEAEGTAEVELGGEKDEEEQEGKMPRETDGVGGSGVTAMATVNHLPSTLIDQKTDERLRIYYLGE